MSNFEPSKLVKGQALFLNNVTKGEWRLPDTAVLSSMYLGQKANPFLAGLRKSEERAVSAYMPIRRAKGTGTERSFEHEGERGDSKESTLDWNSLTEEFSISIKQNDNNMISFEQNYASQMNGCIMNLMERHEAALIALVITDRTEINKGVIQGTFNPDDNVMEVNNSASDRFFHNIKTSMSNNLFNSNIMVIADSLSYMNAEFLASQKTMNATNLGYQFAGLNIMPTTSEIDPDYEGSALAFSMDSVGIIPWIPLVNRGNLDVRDAMSYNGSWGKVTVPILDAKGNTAYTLDFAIHSYATRADNSNKGGSKQDLTIEVEISLDLAYLSNPLSSHRATGAWAGKTDSMVYQFGLLTGGAQ